jgi:hypothetical protein
MAEQPSLGGAIALQGRNRIAEELGKMQFQMGQKEADRLAKKGLEDAKRIAEIEQKFAIPKGQYHRLVLPEIQKTQAVYLDKVKDLKAQRPNNWQNEIQNLSNQYVGEMEKFETLSKDFNDYDTRTASIDKGNTYFSKEWNKFNTAYENAQTLDDFKTKLGQSGFDPTKASDFIVRPNGSISYSPFTNQKPLETLVSQIEKFDGVKVGSKTSRDQFGNLVTEDIKLRPLTYEEADKIKNDPALAGLYSNVAQLPSIEATLDSIIETNPYFAIQYADQRNLSLRRNADGTYAQEDVDVIKKDLLQKVQNMREPKTGRSVTFAPRGGTTVIVGGGAETELGRPTYEYAPIKSVENAKNAAFRLGELNVTYEKELSTIQPGTGEVFDAEFKSFTPRALNKVKPDGVLILAVDKNGNPVPSQGNVQKDREAVAGADVFIRLKAGNNAIYYQKVKNYSNLTSQYGAPKGKKDALDQMIKEMIQKATAYDANIQSIRDQIK